MPTNARPSALPRIRALHRDVGYLTAGLTLVFALSGIAQIYRDTNFLQKQVPVNLQLQPGLDPSALGPALRMREVKVLRTEGSVTYFPGGSYDAATGHAVRTEKQWIFPFDRLTELHKSPSRSAIHWLTNLYAVLLLFMAGSSFFMFRGGSPQQRRGLVLAGLGFMFAIALLFFVPGA